MGLFLKDVFLKYDKLLCALILYEFYFNFCSNQYFLLWFFDFGFPVNKD